MKTDDKVFTCEKEFLLLKKLEAEVNDDQNPDCGCRTCSLQILRHLAYQFAVENNKQYPSAWNNNKVADEVWLLQFEMRHSIEISEYFDLECIADNKASNSPWTTSEPGTTSNI
ncbi:unnamed protein product [Lasius platythorax]|uniref:Uncharacterized protein n=1 Tax=Lasius platythorax TaxID=488582 RepID=A0AAV2NNB9_9HYME